jgi:ribonuclease-3
MVEPGLKQLEAMLGHPFERRALLVQALTHSSLPHEQAGTHGAGEPAHRAEALKEHNEQLEFLGDAVVGLLVAESLLLRYPELHEGELTRLRAALVSRRHLGLVAAKMDLGEHMLVSREMERSGGRAKNSLLANCIEAVIGALFLDAGLDTTRKLVERVVVEPYAAGLREELEQGGTIGDYKSALQDFMRAHHQMHPEYVVRAESGPDHRKRFLVEVRAHGSEGHAMARGLGTTKKKAEQEAARKALGKLKNEAQQTMAMEGPAL